MDSAVLGPAARVPGCVLFADDVGGGCARRCRRHAGRVFRVAVRFDHRRSKALYTMAQASMSMRPLWPPFRRGLRGAVPVRSWNALVYSCAARGEATGNRSVDAGQHSRFGRLHPGRTRQPGNPATWQPGNLATWQPYTAETASEDSSTNTRSPHEPRSRFRTHRPFYGSA
jgi:hypothetical protein